MSPSIVLENSKWLEDLTGKGKALSPRGERQSLLADFGRGGARGYCCFCLLPCEPDVGKRFIIGEGQPIVERVSRIKTVSKRDVTKYMRNHHRQAGFVGEHIDQTPAYYDGMADRERFQRRGQQHAASDFRVDR